MEKLDCDINNASKFIEGQDIDSEAFKIKFGTIYPFTNENVFDYIGKFDFINHNLLTLGSSGDQAINAINRGAKDVTILDINPFVKYYYNLKKAAILTLDRIDYIRFLSKSTDYYNMLYSNLSFNRNVFYKVLETLQSIDYESFLFWDTLLENYDHNLIRTKLFSTDEEHDLNKIKYNPYLHSDVNYAATKKRIQAANVSFVEKNVCDFFTKTKYDNIWLSNVGQYLTIFEFKNVIEKYKGFLDKNGKLLFYIFFQDALYTYKNLINSGKTDLYPLSLNYFDKFNEDEHHFALVYNNK